MNGDREEGVDRSVARPRSELAVVVWSAATFGAVPISTALLELAVIGVHGVLATILGVGFRRATKELS